MTKPKDDGYPIPVGMSDQEFKILYKLWSSSYDDPDPPRDPRRHKLRLNGTSRTMHNSKAKDKTEQFIQQGRATARAQFFITKEGSCGTFGFWLPKSTIISISDSYNGDRHVTFAGWCGINHIEYT